MANEKTREILINFKTNAADVKTQLEDVIMTLDKSSEEYQEAVEQLNNYNAALDQVNASLLNTNASQEELDKTLNTANDQWSKSDKIVKTHQRNLSANSKATKDQTVATKSLTSSVTENGGAMAILSSVTGGWAMVVKDGIEAMGLFNGEINLGSIAQRAYAAVVGTSTGALKAFRIALAATGIGLAVVAIGALVANWDKLKEAISGSTKELDDYNASFNKAQSATKLQNDELDKQVKYLSEIVKNNKLAESTRKGALAQLNSILGITEDTQKVNLKDVEILDAKLGGYKRLAEAQTNTNNLERVYNEQKDKQVELLAKQEAAQKKVNALAVNQKGYGIFGDYNAAKSELDDINQSIAEGEVILNNARANYNQSLQNTITNNALVTDSIDASKKAEDARTKAAEARKKAIEDAAAKEKERLENEKKLLIEIEGLRRKYNVLLTDNAQDKLRIDLENRRLGILDEQNIKQKELDATIAKGSEKYKTAQKTMDDYYNAELQKIEELENSLFESASAFASIQENNAKLLESGTLKDLEKIKDSVADFIADIKNPEIKNAFSEMFEAKDIDKRINELKQIEQILSRTQAQLKPLEDGIEPTTSIAGRNKMIQDNRDFNNTIYTDNENAALKELELLNASEAEKQRIRDYYNKLREDNNDAANKQIELSNRDHYAINTEIAQIYSQNTMALVDSALEFASEGDKERIKSSAKYKDRMIGLTIIDTLAGATAAFMSAQSSYPAPYGTIIGAGLAAGVLATGMANVKKIKSVKMEGSSGGGGDTSTAMAQPNVEFVSSGENQISNSVAKSMNNMGNTPLKTYVVASDVTTAQQLQNNKIESNSI